MGTVILDCTVNTAQTQRWSSLPVGDWEVKLHPTGDRWISNTNWLCHVVTLVQKAKSEATPASRRSPIVGGDYEWVESDHRRDLRVDEI